MKKINPNYNEGMWKGAPASSFLKAQSLRRNEIAEEKILSEKLRNNQLKGYKFRKQHPIGLYITDFYCHQLKLIIEIDGEYHNLSEQIEKDDKRTRILESNGLQLIRFTNTEVRTELENVMEKIKLKIDEIITVL
ncbi:Very-short-patch-repair endonuclease [Chryseobacterium arachidis]|uniref:Very-short-patch-repair endonuclease n=1 Tax=Chryseobacterium arachidis TaxID=1416778 RepID=A0A1M4YZM0_9FLAO|nr:endonuclease domain-containing protein [Chryseobacterium arachidis]SHF11155.1 Very-short-patch-repair endonuclease [Chryseobacterium arachidis]